MVCLRYIFTLFFSFSFLCDEEISITQSRLLINLHFFSPFAYTKKVPNHIYVVKHILDLKWDMQKYLESVKNFMLKNFTMRDAPAWVRLIWKALIGGSCLKVTKNASFLLRRKFPLIIIIHNVTENFPFNSPLHKSFLFAVMLPIRNIKFVATCKSLKK